MPVYEYQCLSCNQRFELRRSFGDNSRVSCPGCQGDARLLFSPVPILFKGPGFYVTDKMEEEKRQKPWLKSEEKESGGSPEEKATTTAKD